MQAWGAITSPTTHKCAYRRASLDFERILRFTTDRFTIVDIRDVHILEG
jgi:hypothetical protein